MTAGWNVVGTERVTESNLEMLTHLKMQCHFHFLYLFGRVLGQILPDVR